MLAFGFDNPWLLTGLVLAAIPVIIHLLHRRQYRETRWAAMRFLIQAARKHSRRIRLEQLVLLGVRMAILLVLPLALAAPFLESSASVPADRQPVHRIVLVDTSMSMQARGIEGTRFEHAQEVVRGIVNAMERGDAVNIVRTAGQPRVLMREPSRQRAALGAEADQLSPTQQPSRLGEALQDVGTLLEAVPDVPRKEVVIVSDFQQSEWSPSEPGHTERLRELLATIDRSVDLTLVTTAGSVGPNHAIVSLEIADRYISADQPVSIRATVAAAAMAESASHAIDLYVDGRLAQSSAIETSPDGGDAAANFRVSLEPGTHAIEARLASDALEPDNHRFLRLAVPDRMEVLLVEGGGAGDRRRSASEYLATALAPRGIESEAFFRPRTIREGEFAGADLSQYACVFLCDVGFLTEAEAMRLREYVQGGGGLVICVGENTRADNCNLVLGGEGALLPAQLGPRVGDAGNPNDVFRFDPSDLSHPIAQPFEGNPNSGLESTLIFEYLRAQPAVNARVALRLGNGDPVIIEHGFGNGRVVLVTTSFDAQWNTWPVQNSFPPIAHGLVRFAAGGMGDNGGTLVGEPIEVRFPGLTAASDATLTLPGGNTQALPARRESDGVIATTDATQTSGVYRVALNSTPPRETFEAVNVNTSESRLETLSETHLRAGLLSGREFAFANEYVAAAPFVGSGGAGHASLVRWLLAVLLGLLLVEQLMAWQFRIGLVALIVLGTAGLLVLAGSSSTAPSIVGAIASAVIAPLIMRWLERRKAARKAASPG